jgi:hypothetical protein
MPDKIMGGSVNIVKPEGLPPSPLYSSLIYCVVFLMTFMDQAGHDSWEVVYELFNSLFIVMFMGKTHVGFQWLQAVLTAYLGERNLVRKESGQYVHQYCAAMPESQRQCLLLLNYIGKKHKEDNVMSKLFVHEVYKDDDTCMKFFYQTLCGFVSFKSFAYRGICQQMLKALQHLHDDKRGDHGRKLAQEYYLLFRNSYADNVQVAQTQLEMVILGELDPNMPPTQQDPRKHYGVKPITQFIRSHFKLKICCLSTKQWIV